MEVDFGDGRDGDAGHLLALGDDVGAHFAAADKADADGPSFCFLPPGKIGGEPDGAGKEACRARDVKVMGAPWDPPLAFSNIDTLDPSMSISVVSVRTCTKQNIYRKQ